MRANQNGFTLIELLSATLVSVLLAMIVTVGIKVSLDTQHEAVAGNEALTLLSTLTDAIGNELRFARNVHLQEVAGTGGQDNYLTLEWYDSAQYGRAANITIEEGKLKVGSSNVLSDAAYGAADNSIGKYAISQLDIRYDKLTSTYTVTIEVEDLVRPGSIKTPNTFTVKSLNGNAIQGIRSLAGGA